MRIYYKRSNCRYCFSKDLKLFFSLGNQPPSNSFISKKQIKFEKKFPLRLYVCRKCYLVQLLDVVSGKKIFDKYSYLSSSSKALVEHFQKLTKNVEKRFKIKNDDLVVDIGCNDGIMLDAYTVNSKKIGIEPSDVSRIAKKKGHIIYNEFFNIQTANKIRNRYGAAKIVTATNVFAHIDDMHSVLRGVNRLIDKDGIFIVEVSYLPDLIDQNLFDTVYHEHLCYLSLFPLSKFLTMFEMEVFDVRRKKVGASGPSITFYIKKKINKRKVYSSVRNLYNYEKNWGINKLKKYLNFEKKIKSNKIKTLKLISLIKKDGNKLFCFGAPAKGNTLLNYYNLNSDIIDFVSDNSITKQGKYTPGSKIKIVSDEFILKKNYKYALLLSWNYKEFFLKNSKFIKKGGKFIVPLPYPKIIPK
jgi:hypothetical protein